MHLGLARLDTEAADRPTSNYSSAKSSRTAIKLSAAPCDELAGCEASQRPERCSSWRLLRTI